MSDEIVPTPKRRFKDRTGERFGCFTVLSYSGRHPRLDVPMWLCKCDCGAKSIARLGTLRAKKGKCCKQCRSDNISSKSEYFIWMGMRSRCRNPNATGYRAYGGRGIRVCERWNSSFRNFFADMGDRPSPDRSIDRINNDGHYSCGQCEECIANGWPANCRWATWEQQLSNKRKGKRKCQK